MTYRVPEAPADDTQPACLFCAGAIVEGRCAACEAPAVPADPAAPRAPCPRCALTLDQVSLERATTWRCPRCRGAFIPNAAWDAIIGAVRARRAVDVAAFVPPPPPDQPTGGRLVPSVACLACGRDMERAHFGAVSETIVDVCARHGLWLDSAELGAVLAFARKLWDAGGQLPISEQEREQRRALMTYLSARAVAQRWALDEAERQEKERDGGYWGGG